MKTSEIRCPSLESVGLVVALVVLIAVVVTYKGYLPAHHYQVVLLGQFYAH